MSKQTVLIVDDSLTVRMDLQETFDSAGFHSRGCATVAAARAALEQGAMDVIVLDVRLPDGDGVSLLQEIRSSGNNANAVVVMLTTETEVKDRVRGMRTGADEYVGKPYDTRFLLARIKELLRVRRDPRAPSQQPSILVMDDSITFRESLRETFTRAGYRVELASNGEEGLRMAQTSRPSAMVIDNVMPGIDGATVIRRVRLDESLRGVPCLLMTGSDDHSDELRALDAGADAFVRKDDNTEVIVAKLGAALRSASGSLSRDGVTPMGPKRVLAVIDSEQYLTDISIQLKQEGYDVVPARSGEESLDLLGVQAVDCILLDLTLPGMGGKDTCRRIKAAPIVRDIPLIMLTPPDDRQAMLDGLGSGADDCLTKTGEFDVLKARVRAQIRRKQFEDENRRIRLELLKAELDASEARAAKALAESRAELLAALEQKNQALEAANVELKNRGEEVAQAYSELTAANEAKSDFLSTMSHELRTPLNAIIGFSYIMIDGISGPLTQKQREFVGHIHEGGQHLLSLVNDILDLSKIESGKADIDPEPIHLDTLLNDAQSVVQEKAAAHHIRILYKELNLPDTFSADRRRLKQIVYNLLSNAVKFTPDNGTIHLAATLVDREQAAHGIPGFKQGVRMDLPANDHQTFVQITVTDSGIGIAPEDLDKLFKPFTQIKNELTRKIEGTGLGLATVMRLAQLHGGTVGLSSESGQGSCFCVWLPWKNNQIPSALPADHDGEAEDPSQPLALVIEDDPHAVALMSAQLKVAGFRVRHAISGELALQLVSDFTPDLITLDIRLPGMDGWDFLARIKELPAWANVPVVVVSLDASHDIGVSVGAKAVLQKPFGPGELRQELDRLGFQPPSHGEIKIMIVDDDPCALELMTAYLRQPGYTILTAFGGQEGIAMIQQHKPDLVVLDLLMPDIGGIEVVEALKRDPDTASIPVIMVTARQFSDADREQLSDHVMSVVNKTDLHHDRFIGEVRRAFSHPTLPA
jgi:DNA-binding response OmpR family regulator